MRKKHEKQHSNKFLDRFERGQARFEVTVRVSSHPEQSSGPGSGRLGDFESVRKPYPVVSRAQGQFEALGGE